MVALHGKAFPSRLPYLGRRGLCPLLQNIGMVTEQSSSANFWTIAFPAPPALPVTIATLSTSNTGGELFFKALRDQ